MNGLSTIKPGGTITAGSRNGTDQGGSPAANPAAAIKRPEALASTRCRRIDKAYPIWLLDQASDLSTMELGGMAALQTRKNCLMAPYTTLVSLVTSANSQ
ncbi:hypothetical protein MPLB_1670085 [Mesorhizobium sp. ORS 3324]|nr:hypothetical protein MPLB_1670085 [Mesorhizobium sp. ORS 3324]